MTEFKKRLDFVLGIEVIHSNPNGDPDNGNRPRVDPITGHGYITDVCLKRKIRDYVAARHALTPPNDIYIRHGANLQALREEVVNQAKGDKSKAGKENSIEALCRRFYDIRAFGAVMGAKTEELALGRLQGPVQFTNAISVSPIQTLDLSIARVANENKESEFGVFGTKPLVSYGFYVACGSVSPVLAARSGFSEEDWALTEEAMREMFTGADKSAVRSNVSVRWGVVFTHHPAGDDNGLALGRCHHRRLWDMVKAKPKAGVDFVAGYDDLDVSDIDALDGLPEGVTVRSFRNY